MMENNPAMFEITNQLVIDGYQWFLVVITCYYQLMKQLMVTIMVTNVSLPEANIK